MWPMGLGPLRFGSYFKEIPPSPAKVILVFLQKTLFGFHTTNICFLYSKYEDCADWKLPDLGGNHENCFEPGPYGTVWADNCAASLPPALGSLWDASRTPKPPKNQKIPGFRGLGVQGVRPPYFPCVGKLELLLQGVDSPLVSRSSASWPVGHLWGGGV